MQRVTLSELDLYGRMIVVAVVEKPGLGKALGYSISSRFLTRFLKTLYENYTTLQARFNGRIGVPVLKTVLKLQLVEDGHNSP